jgi:hypothetical protein
MPDGSNGAIAAVRQRMQLRQRVRHSDSEGAIAGTDGPDADGPDAERSRVRPVGTGLLCPGYGRRALRMSPFMRAMVSSGMPFGQTVWQTPVLVQPPKPSASICSTIAVTRW